MQRNEYNTRSCSQEEWCAARQDQQLRGNGVVEGSTFSNIPTTKWNRGREKGWGLTDQVWAERECTKSEAALTGIGHSRRLHLRQRYGKSPAAEKKGSWLLEPHDC